MQIGIDNIAANQSLFTGGVSASKESFKTEDKNQLSTGVSDTVQISLAAQELLKAETTDSGGGVEPPQNPVEPDLTQEYTAQGSDEPLTLMSGGGVEPPAPFSGGGVEPPKR